MPTQLAKYYTASLTAVKPGVTKPTIIFDAVNIPMKVQRSGGEPVYQLFTRPGLPPVKLFVRRDLYTYTLTGTYETHRWDEGSPFHQLRTERDEGLSFDLKVNYNFLGPTLTKQGLAPHPFDPIPQLPSAGANPADTLRVTIGPLDDEGENYFLSVPREVNWSMVLQEDSPVEVTDTSPTPPAPPTTPSATAIYNSVNSSITLRWTPADFEQTGKTIVNFRVAWTVNGGSLNTGTAGALAARYSISSVIANATYVMTVRAIYGDGSHLDSSPVTLTAS